MLVWGDIPFIQPETVSGVVQSHFQHHNDFTFATRLVDSAYTVVSRDLNGQVMSVVETREHEVDQPIAGERDIGLFVFRKGLILSILNEDLPGKFGKGTGEHGFLYVIQHLASRNLKIEALTIATDIDLVSLNRVEDLSKFNTEANN